MTDLDGRTIVITGAAGMLGRQWANHLLSRGCRVFGLDTVVDSAAVNTDALYWFPSDVRNPSDMRRALDMAQRVFGSVDGLVNAAGIDVKPDTPGCGPFEELDLESWQQTLSVNLTGTMVACQVFGSDMAARRAGSIVNVASVYAVRAPDQRIYDVDFTKPAAYSASKAGVLGLTRWLAGYWGKKGVRVNAVVLGGTYQEHQREMFRCRYERHVPLDRMARAGEYSELIAFLLGDGAQYMTGSTVTADGGYTIL